MLRKEIQIVVAPSILGLKPTGVEKLPDALLSRGLKEKLNAKSDLITVSTYNDRYSTTRNPSNGVINNDIQTKFLTSLHSTIYSNLDSSPFQLVLGGDCSILIGVMSALKAKGTFGLFFLDAHADFYEPEKSLTGEAADMDLAIITGRGPDLLSDKNKKTRYVEDGHIFHIGQRDIEETKKFRSQDIRSTGIHCFDASFIEAQGVDTMLGLIEDSCEKIFTDGFWIHFDTDVLSDAVNPAVDYRLPDGLTLEMCENILKNLLNRYQVVGMTITIFNPMLDQGGKIADQLTESLTRIFY
jgi:arginase